MNSETQETRTFHHNIPKRRDKRYHTQAAIRAIYGAASRIDGWLSVCTKPHHIEMVSPEHERAVDTTATQYFQNSCLPNQTRIHTRYYIGVVVSFSLPLFYIFTIIVCISDNTGSVCFVMWTWMWTEEKKTQESNSKVVDFWEWWKFLLISKRYLNVSNQSKWNVIKENEPHRTTSWQTATSWLQSNNNKMDELILSIVSEQPKWNHWEIWWQ